MSFMSIAKLLMVKTQAKNHLTYISRKALSHTEHEVRVVANDTDGLSQTLA